VIIALSAPTPRPEPIREGKEEEEEMRAMKMTRMTRRTRLLLGALGALSLVVGSLVVTGTHQAQARNCLINRCDWDYLPPAR
jgi:hypothetical protein